MNDAQTWLAAEDPKECEVPCEEGGGVADERRLSHPRKYADIRRIVSTNHSYNSARG